MAINQTARQSDLEKRLRLLRQQVYGKSQSPSVSYQSSDNHSSPAHEHSSLTDEHSSLADKKQIKAEGYSDTTYLYHDLLKISVLSALAIGTQVILFFLSKHHILNLNFI